MGKPLPPPIRRPQNNQQMLIPFILAEQPRMFLNLLALNSQLPERFREIIAHWLLHHNQAMASYLTQTYGMQGFVQADLIAKAMSEHFLASIKEDNDAAEVDLFDALESQMLRDEGGEGDVPVL